MIARLVELLDLAFRWVHVIAGIMWIGNSLLFNWLDRILEPSTREDNRDGMQGETWLLHSGGFYFVEKTQLAGQPLPRVLHWFKWQAYTTWLSGAVLLVVVYYAGGRALLVDPAVAPLSPGVAVGIAAGSIVVAWIVYDLIWRFVGPRSAAAALALSGAGLVAYVIALTSLLSGRAAFLHVGAMMGTLMAGNVGHVIIPSQRALVASVGAAGGADATLADRAKTRSIHNNYLTFPVVVLMVSAHFPSFFGGSLPALTLLAIIATGMAVRHLMNVRFTHPRWRIAMAATLAVAAAGLYLLVGRPPSGAPMLAGEVPAAVNFADVRSIVDRRCSTCHSQAPADRTFGPAPAGVAFDSPEQIIALTARIHERAVATRTMPPANVTRMTEYERAVLGAWTAGR